MGDSSGKPVGYFVPAVFQHASGSEFSPLYANFS